MGRKRAAAETPDDLQATETGWTDTLAICRKCGKKLGGGFGPAGDDRLKRALRLALRARGRRGTIGIMETGCLGVCPKGGVTVARGRDPGRLLVVTPGRLDALLDRILAE